MTNLPKIRSMIYDMLEQSVVQNSGNNGNDISFSQDVKAVIKKHPNEKTPIQIIQVQSVNISSIVLMAVKMLRELEEEPVEIELAPKKLRRNRKKKEIVKMLKEGVPVPDIINKNIATQAYVYRIAKENMVVGEG